MEANYAPVKRKKGSLGKLRACPALTLLILAQFSLILEESEFRTKKVNQSHRKMIQNTPCRLTVQQWGE
jgi:hypothetical protein